jgi:hypothetical protein
MVRLSGSTGVVERGAGVSRAGEVPSGARVSWELGRSDSLPATIAGLEGISAEQMPGSLVRVVAPA